MFRCKNERSRVAVAVANASTHVFTPNAQFVVGRLAERRVLTQKSSVFKCVILHAIQNMQEFFSRYSIVQMVLGVSENRLMRLNSRRANTSISRCSGRLLKFFTATSGKAKSSYTADHCESEQSRISMVSMVVSRGSKGRLCIIFGWKVHPSSS